MTISLSRFFKKSVKSSQGGSPEERIPGVPYITIQQQQPRPFHVVLVDIEKAAKDKEIHCVETPLEGNVSFVALSYRWGELEEETVATKAGYVATVKSFSMYDFYELCRMMAKEPDLQSIKYVWVDALCVDQSNDERRKATIYQMTNIYERAAYIVAVPDLHQQHLKQTSQANHQITMGINYYSAYLYSLIHGDTKTLALLDYLFLDCIGVPHDPTIRQHVAKYTNYFVEDHTFGLKWNGQLTQILHGYTASQSYHEMENPLKTGICGGETYFDGFHRCHHVFCPLEYDVDDKPPADKQEIPLPLPWKAQVMARNMAIRQAMLYFQDVINDWSTRVWVISEYNIAKKKNNLKYWFIGLDTEEMYDLTFFKFNFDDTDTFSAVRNARPQRGTALSLHQIFHVNMIDQLNAQTFFQMMLTSKASRHEDRFYAIFPESKYKNHISQVALSEIHTLLSVKLTLYEMMDTKDKLELLYLLGHSNSNVFKEIPTFATPSLNHEGKEALEPMYPCNFDLNSLDTITLCYDHVSHYLELTPKTYFFKRKLNSYDTLRLESAKKILYHCFCLDDTNATFDIVYIPYFDESAIVTSDDDEAAKKLARWRLILVGCLRENKWVLSFAAHETENQDEHHFIRDTGIVFEIY
ncbi:unnamed protein product [Absidia cylindrospora]